MSRDFDTWIRDVPQDLETQIAQAQGNIAYWQDRLVLLFAAKRLVSSLPPKKTDTAPPPTPPCFGDIDIWNPELKKCKGCAVEGDCAKKVAEAVKT